MTTRPARRWALLLVATALAAGPVVVRSTARADSSPCGSGQPTVVITTVASDAPPQNTPVTCTDLYADSTAGQVQTPYTQYTTHDIATGSPPASGPVQASNYLTLADLLHDAGVTLSPTSIVQLPRNNDSHSVLTADDLGDPSAFVDDQPPIVTLDGDTIEYVRAQRADDPDDPNGDDPFTPTDGELDITVDLQGTLLHPVITAPAGLHKGVPATFHVSPTSPNYTYDWDFEDAPTGSGPAPSHSFSRPGNYGVRVTVSDATDNAYGTSDVTIVSVGKPEPPTTGPTGGHGTGASSSPPTGPDHGSGSGGSGHPTTSARPGAGGSSDAATTTAPPATGTPVSGGTVSGGRNSAGSSSGSAAPPATGTPTTTRSTTGTDGSGMFVDGVVIDAANVAAPSRSHPGGPPSGDVAGEQASRRPGEPPFDAKLLWWLTIPALLALGVASERRRPRRRAPRH